MIGELFINGKDAFLSWGIYLTDDAISAILTPPPTKKPITNSSRREHGVKVVRSNPKVDSREITVQINLSASSREDFFQKYLSFCEELKKEFLDFKLIYQPTTIYRFSYKNCQQFSQYRLGAAKFILRLEEFNPEDRSV